METSLGAVVLVEVMSPVLSGRLTIWKETRESAVEDLLEVVLLLEARSCMLHHRLDHLKSLREECRRDSVRHNVTF